MRRSGSREPADWNFWCKHAAAVSWWSGSREPADWNNGFHKVPTFSHDQALASLRIETIIRYCHKLYYWIRLSRACGLKLFKSYIRIIRGNDQALASLRIETVINICQTGECIRSGSREPADWNGEERPYVRAETRSGSREPAVWSFSIEIYTESAWCRSQFS